MKPERFLLLAVICILASVHLSYSQTPDNPLQKPGWDVVFHDEFDNDALINSGNWKTGYGWGQTLVNEREYYTRYDKNFPTTCDKGGNNHIFTTDGASSVLKLEAKIENSNYEVWHWDANGNFYTTCENYNYTSGMLWSSQPFLYGYFEIRCKVPNKGKLLWPAFWLWEGDGGYREIDVFEFSDPSIPNKVGMNLHIAQKLDNGYVAPHHSGTNNDYPGDYVITSGPDVTSAFHTYAVRWTPNVVVWYVDNNPVYTITKHVPHLNMHLIANLALAPWYTYPSNLFPSDFVIDYIRVYKSESKEFMWQWGNGGKKQIHWWNMNPTDKYIIGDFDGDGKDELLAIATNGWSHLMKYDGTGWQTPWSNNGSGQINWWLMKSTDKYIAGDFDGDGKDELLAVATNGWSHMMKYNGTAWQTPWSNEGAGTIHLWYMKYNDRYISGRFDGGGAHNLLALSWNGWSHLINYMDASGSAEPVSSPAANMNANPSIDPDPTEYKLEQNYPNPFNPTTTIEFALPEQAVVTLKVYNTLGQEVATLLNHELLDAGSQEADFDASKLPSGVYFYRIIAEGIGDEEQGTVGQRYVSVKKMMLMK